ncbi:hypothetical protein F944_00870 [Acinetobacter ursingii DSM 16037 = CIP 107286]|nr:hypothetical protein F944_00870 [Acinetobacter ursingii DSM 16037 = CIP 107286]
MSSVYVGSIFSSTLEGQSLKSLQSLFTFQMKNLCRLQGILSC